ncbi:MAG: aminopeptidase N [bacterium]
MDIYRVAGAIVGRARVLIALGKGWRYDRGKPQTSTDRMMKEGSPRTIYLKDYTVPAYLVKSVDLYFDLRPGETLVTTRAVYISNPESQDDSGALRLEGEQLELLSVTMDGELLPAEAYSVDDEGLTLHSVPQRFELETRVRIHPEDNTALEGLYQSSGNYCTQCEAQGFRKITYFPDRPDVMTIFTTTIEADVKAFPVLLSNGNLVSEGELAEGRHFATWLDPFAKPAYLFALVAGDLAKTEGSFTTQSGREVALHIFTEAHNAHKTQHAVRSLQKAMKWDEERFGLGYDLDVYMIVAVDDFNMGAMENKGLNVFNSKFVLALPDSATDVDYVNIEAVIAHEYFHNWTGNRVTCRDWFQLSLKEGLTVFRDQSFTADMTSAAVKRIDDVRMLRAHQFPEDASPMAHPIRPSSFIEINNFYTVTVYEKGAEVVRLYETLLGRDGFRKGMDLYFERHDGQAVTTDDFRKAMADANGVDLSLLQRWYEQAGTPQLHVSESWDEAQGQYTLTLSQRCAPTPETEEKQPFPIPVRIGLLGADGAGLPLQLADEETQDNAPLERVLLLEEESRSFVFTGLSERPVPSLLRGFSAPVQLHYDWTDEQLAFLMTNDSDEFNRWEAGQTLATKVLMGLVEDVQQGNALTLNPHLLSAYRALLEDSQADPALLAEALLLPDMSYLAEQMSVIDVDAIYAAREFVRQTLSSELGGLWQAVYTANATDGEYSLDALSMGKRRLKNVALSYLLEGGDEASVELAMSQFSNATNMTDTMGALSPLVHSGAKEAAEKVLASFEARFKEDTLVMDKWFSVQATAPAEETLAAVQRLMEHPLFSLQNPNKVRALIGAFAQANPVGFHAKDGSGYRFVADIILQLDALNPQVASRMSKIFTRWKRYDSSRQALMKAQLERIHQHEGLSRDVFEVVDRSLS